MPSDAERSAPSAVVPVNGLPAALWQQIIESAPEIVTLLDATGNMMYQSPAVRTLLGYDPQELLGKSAFQYIHPADLPRMAAALARVLPHVGEQVQLQLRFRHRDNSWRLIHGRGRRLPDQDGQVRLVTHLSAAAPSVEVAETLRESEEQLAGILEGMLDGFALHEIICDDAGRPVDYRFLYINRAFEQLTGLSRAIVGQTVLQAMPGTEQYWIETYGRVALNGETVEMTNRAAELGKWFEVRAFQTQPGQFAVVFRDVSEARATQEALLSSEERYRRLVDGATDPIFVLDAQGTFLQANIAAASTFGLTPEQLVGRSMPELFPAPIAASQLATIRQVIATETPTVTQSRSQINGEPVWYSTTIQPLANADGRIDSAQLMARDITAQMRAQEQLGRDRDGLERLVRERTADLAQANEQMASEIERRKASEKALRSHADDLERFNRLAVDRELRMIALKQEVNDLAARLGLQQPYDLGFVQNAGEV